MCFNSNNNSFQTLTVLKAKVVIRCKPTFCPIFLSLFSLSLCLISQLQGKLDHSDKYACIYALTSIETNMP